MSKKDLEKAVSDLAATVMRLEEELAFERGANETPQNPVVDYWTGVAALFMPRPAPRKGAER
jgi:hypothetical protein